jgi:hypothetical protein
MIGQRRIMVCVFIFAAIATLVFFVVERPRILIIESESAGTHRSKQFRGGWAQTIQNKHLLVKVIWYSLEQDLHPDSDAKTMGALRTVEREDPDLVILVDDVANERVGRVLAAKAQRHILFVGIDQPPAYYGYSSKDQITGIIEQLRLEPFHDLLSILYPNSSLKYGVIGVDNASGRARLEQIRGCPWSQHVLSDALLVKTFTEWQDFIENHQDLDVLLILNVENLANQEGEEINTSVRDVVSWTESNSKPLPIGVEANYVANSGGLAFEVSPRHFGEMASIRAKEWLPPSHAVPKDYLQSNEFQVALCQSRLAARNLKVPPIYEESARLSGTLYP